MRYHHLFTKCLSDVVVKESVPGSEQYTNFNTGKRKHLGIKSDLHS